MYLARHQQASLVLYITDMPTTAAWLDHVYGSYTGQGEPFRDREVEYVLYSSYTHLVLILYSSCAHLVLILYSSHTHLVLIL